MTRFWTLNKLVALGVLGAFAFLLLELRFDHRDVLGEHWQAFAPLIYSGAMIIVGGAALALWHRGGRVVLLWGFSIALAIGVVGFWMHNHGKPVQGVQRIAAAWSQPIQKTESESRNEPALEEPPVLAPLAFFGLGILGMLSCASRFQTEAKK